jgi:hypothetical protein
MLAAHHSGKRTYDAPLYQQCRQIFNPAAINA